MESITHGDRDVTVPVSAVLMPTASSGRGVAELPAPTPNPVGLLKALRRRLRLALILGVAGGVVAAGVTYLAVRPAKYTTRARLHVATVSPRILVRTAESETQVDFATYQRTQLAMIRSRLVLEKVLEDPEVAALPVIRKQPDPFEWLEQELEVSFANGSEVLVIGASGDDARTPAVIVNAVTQAYLDEVVNAETKQRRERAEMLQKTWRGYQDRLQLKREEIRKLTLTAGSSDRAVQVVSQRNLQDRLTVVQQDLVRVRSELRPLRIDLEIRESQAKGADPLSPEAVEAELAQDPVLLDLTAQMEEARKSYWSVRRIAARQNDPALKRHLADYRQAEAAMEARRQRLRPIVEERLRQRSQGQEGGDATLAALRQRVKLLEGLESMLEGEVKELSARADNTARATVDLTATEREVMYAEEMANLIGAEVEKLTLELQAPPRVRLLERAEVPRAKDEMRRVRAAGLAGCGLFGLALAGVSIWEFLARRIDSPDEVVHRLGLRIIGTLPAQPRAVRRSSDPPNGRRMLAWQGVLVESIEATRAALLHASRTDSIRVLMITSALGGEGKTSLACQMAVSLARAGRRTLLIDCDLRSPAAHRLFDAAGAPGFCESLRGEISFEDATQATPVGGLSLMAAGRYDDEASQAIARVDLRSLFERLKQRFDFVIIDSSPVLPVADGLPIAQQADGVILAILSDKSREPAVSAANHRLTSIGVRVLGAVVAGVHGESYGAQPRYTCRSDVRV